MQATATLRNSESLQRKLRGIVEDSDFKILLLATLENMGPYKKNLSMSATPHLQSMISGGKEAIDLFLYNLYSLPYKEAQQEEEALEFVPPSELHNLV